MEVTSHTAIVQVDESLTSARVCDKHGRSSLSPEFKKVALNGVTKEFSDFENESDDYNSDE